MSEYCTTSHKIGNFAHHISANILNMWIEAAKEAELPENGILCKKIEGKQILIIRSGGKLFSCGAICPHQGYSMEHGLVFDDEITCPEHSWVFSLRTGELTYPGAGPRIPVYALKMADGKIRIEI